MHLQHRIGVEGTGDCCVGGVFVGFLALLFLLGFLLASLRCLLRDAVFGLLRSAVSPASPLILCDRRRPGRLLFDMLSLFASFGLALAFDDAGD